MAKLTAAFRANAIRQLVAVGYGEGEAARLVDNRSGGGADTAHGETVVPDASGTGIRQKGRAGSLYAAVEASAVIQYDQGAIAAIWQGMVDALRTGGAVDVEALFPDPCSVNMPPPRRYAQERAMGAEMAKLLPLAVKALHVTTDEWAAWYARSALIRVRHGDGCGCGCNTGHAPQLPAAGGTVGGWGSPFGPPAFGGGQSGGGGAGSGM